MVNEMDKSFSTKAAIVMSVKAKDVFIQQIIELYKEISNYKKVISEAQKGENDRIISRSINHTKALWQILKRNLGIIK
jgi:hypothetical protein